MKNNEKNTNFKKSIIHCKTFYFETIRQIEQKNNQNQIFGIAIGIAIEQPEKS